jgi:para-nitrobenzyl esterase
MGFVLPSPTKPESGENQCSVIEKASADLRQRAIWSTYWFPMTDINDKQDQSISGQMSKSWAAFAKTNNPNVSGQADWPLYNLKADVLREFNQGKNGLVHALEKDRVDYQIKTLRVFYRID